MGQKSKYYEPKEESEPLYLTFDEAISTILGHEGGYVNHKNDKGGATKYGISLMFLKGCGIDKEDLDKDGITLEPIGDLDNNGVVDKNDIRLITVELAKKLYKIYFWDKAGVERFNSTPLRLQLFDIAVNMGTGMVGRLIQKAVNSVQPNALVEDGIIGEKTTAKVNAIVQKSEKELNNRLVEERRMWYRVIVSRNPKQEVFLNGWDRRAKSFYL